MPIHFSAFDALIALAFGAFLVAWLAIWIIAALLAMFGIFRG